MAKPQIVKNRERNPFAAVYPDLSAGEFSDLKKSIVETGGPLIPIQLDAEDRVLDGWHRFLVCKEMFIKPKFQKWVGRGSAELYIRFIVAAETRRQLTTSQRQAAAAKMANIPHGGHNKNRTDDIKNAETGEKQEPNLALAPKVTLKQAAKENKVSVAGVKAAKKVMEQAPEIFEEVRAGKKTVTAALKEIEQSEPEEPVDLEDCFGNPLKGKIADAFSEAGELAELRSRIDKIRQEVEAMCERADPLATYLMGTTLQGFTAEMKSAAAKIKFAIPFCLCPKCSGDKCLACKKQGWMPKEHYEQVIPKELQWKKK